MATLKVRDIMTSQVITLSENDKLSKAIATFSLDEITGAPVIDSDYRMIGLISETDLLNYIIKFDKLHNPNGLDVLDSDKPECAELTKKMLAELDKITVGDIMCRTVLSASPNSPVREVLEVMMSKDVNRLPVLEKGVLVGIVTRGDIVTMLHRHKY